MLFVCLESPLPGPSSYCNMGCICSTRDRGTSESLVHLHSFSLFEDRVNARSFDQWERIIPYLSSADWLSLHLVCKKMKKLTGLKTKTTTRLTFASLNSLSFSVELSTAQEYRHVLTPIPAESVPSSHTSPFLTGQSLQNLLSSIASRSVTPLGFLPMNDDIEQALKTWKVKIWEDVRVGRADALFSYANSGVKPLAAVLDLTFKLEHIVVSLSLLATAVSTGNPELVKSILDCNVSAAIDDVEPDRGLCLERTQVDTDEKIDTGGVKKFETRVSPLQLAAAKGMAVITELLVKAGANVNMAGTKKTDLTYLIKYLELGLPPVLLAAKGLVDDPIELELPIKIVPVEYKKDFPGTLQVLIRANATLQVSAEEPLMFYCLKYPELLNLVIEVMSISGTEEK